MLFLLDFTHAAVFLESFGEHLAQVAVNNRETAVHTLDTLRIAVEKAANAFESRRKDVLSR